MNKISKKIILLTSSILSMYASLFYQSNKPPLVSVIIPTYNRAHLLSRALDSVLYQGFFDYEIIVVDDASSDKTISLLKKYQQKTNKIKVFRHSENKGVSAARNTALKYARGKYVILLDSDDFALPNMLKTEVEFMLNHPTYDLGIPKKSAFNGNKVNFLYEWHYDVHEFLDGNHLGNVGNIFKRDFIKKHNIRYKEGQICAEDYYFWIQMIQKGAKIIKIESVEPIVAFRVHHENNYKSSCYDISQFSKHTIANYFNVSEDNNCAIYSAIIKKYPRLMKTEDIEKGFKFYCK